MDNTITIDSQKTLINNKNVFAFASKEELLGYVADKHKILIALNAEKLLKNSKELDGIINENIGYSDGIGTVLALRKKGKKAVKIAGSELWLDLIKTYYKTKSFYFVGSTQEVIDETILKLKGEYPKLEISGYRNGYLQNGDLETLKRNIKQEKPDVVFVAQGSPKQELLMNELIKEHPALYMGLGGSFDVYVGALKRAPRMFIKLGLEWFYRLLQEPRRWKRQLLLFVFFFKLQFNKL